MPISSIEKCVRLHYLFVVISLHRPFLQLFKFITISSQFYHDFELPFTMFPYYNNLYQGVLPVMFHIPFTYIPKRGFINV